MAPEAMIGQLFGLGPGRIRVLKNTVLNSTRTVVNVLEQGRGRPVASDICTMFHGAKSRGTQTLRQYKQLKPIHTKN